MRNRLRQSVLPLLLLWRSAKLLWPTSATERRASLEASRPELLLRLVLLRGLLLRLDFPLHRARSDQDLVDRSRAGVDAVMSRHIFPVFAFAPMRARVRANNADQVASFLVDQTSAATPMVWSLRRPDGVTIELANDFCWPAVDRESHRIKTARPAIVCAMVNRRNRTDVRDWPHVHFQ